MRRTGQWPGSAGKRFRRRGPGRPLSAQTGRKIWAASRRQQWQAFGPAARSRSIALANIRTGGLLGIEKKYLDIPMTATAIATSASLTSGELPPTSVVTGCYSAPAQGDGPTNRDGNRIVITECNMQGTISCAAQNADVTADTANYVFLCMIQDTQTNGTQLNSEDVFTNPSASSINGAQPFRNLSYTRRFKLLAWKRYKMPVPSIAWDGDSLLQFGIHIPIKLKWKGKMPVTFTTASTTADIANVTDNSIQLVGFASVNSMAPQLVLNCRTRFFG